jgi:formylglycine-generating enzyme required for sulfatase activity
MSPEGKVSLFSPQVKATLESLGESVTGLAAAKDGTLYVAGPSAILKVKLDGTVSTLVHPVVVKDCKFDLEDSRSRFFHEPYLRGLDVTPEGVVYTAVTGCHSVIKVTPEGVVQTVLHSEHPWSPTGIAVRGTDLFLLEYSNIEHHKNWTPRVRKIEASGKSTTLAVVEPINTPDSSPKAFEGSKAGEEREVGGVKLCWCPPGRFKMGSPASEPDHRPDEAQVDVTLSRGFWIGKYEVTQAQWKRVAGEYPGERTETAGLGDDFPVYWVNFDGAETFCRNLTKSARASGELPDNWAFQLPTEAQWEYACRAGTTTATSFGDTLDRNQANFAGKPYGMEDGPNAGPALHHATKVGSYPPNPWGVHDMHGNEFEWCRDWYHERLPGGVDPDLYSVQGTRNGDGTYSRSRRGGSWGDDGRACRSALRLRYEPPRGADHIGFRVVVVKNP